MANALGVRPTRMELSRLKGNLTIATRGHKLLKDKQDELMRQFISLIRRNNELRQEVEGQLTTAMQSFVAAKALLPEKFVDELVAIPTQTVSLDIRDKNIMSVNVPEMNIDYNEQDGSDFSYGYLNSNSEIDDALRQLNALVPKLLELSQVEKTAQLMADEIEGTRRRVNALEHRMIPDTQETIEYIEMKLEENERATITRMIKIKDMED